MKKLKGKNSKIAGQMLGIMEVCTITGLSKTCITDQIHAGKIAAILVARRFVIPGGVLLEYMKTPEYEKTKRKSGCYTKSPSGKESDNYD